jgi:hypothetical protein
MSEPGKDLRASLIIPPSDRFHPPRTSNPLNKNSAMSASERLASLRSNRAARGDVNVDYPAEPAARTSAPIKDNTMTKAPSGLPVYGVNEYLSAYQAENKDLIASREAAKSPAAKKLKMDENAAPGPVAVGAKSSKHTIILNDTHQALALPQPHFKFEGSTDSGWTAEVSFVGLDIAELQNVKEPGRFNSKQEAKEATSKRAVDIIEVLKDEGRIKTPVKGSKRKKAQTAAEPGTPTPKENQPPVENYIGQLLGTYNTPSLPSLRKESY